MADARHQNARLVSAATRSATPWRLPGPVVLSLVVHCGAVGGIWWGIGGQAASAPGPVDPVSRVTWEAQQDLMPREEQSEVSEPSAVVVEDQSPEPDLEPISWPVEVESEDPLDDPVEVERSEAVTSQLLPFEGPVPPQLRLPRRQTSEVSLKPEPVEPAPAASTPSEASSPPPPRTRVESAIVLATPVGHEDSLRKLRRLASRHRWKGAATVRVSVSSHGRAVGGSVSHSSGSSRQDDAILNAVLSWRFSPATRDGEAVPCTLYVPFRF